MRLQLTIDINIQKSIKRELDNVVSMMNPDMALAVVMKHLVETYLSWLVMNQDQLRK
mgnify:CR=1 FL=1